MKIMRCPGAFIAQLCRTEVDFQQQAMKKRRNELKKITNK